jgi:hypothetical protein
MRRRDLLRGTGAAVLLSGCLAEGPTADHGTPTPTPGHGTGTPGHGTDGADTATDSSGGGDGRITDRSFEVLENTCGTETDRAVVAFGDRTVTVRGTISGANTCYTATLESARYDGGSDTLSVAVEAIEQSPDRVCGQCIVEIDYETQVTFEGELPGRVRVSHDGERVTAQTR